MSTRILTVSQSAALLCFMSSAHADESSWTDRFAFNGDFRLRWEGIEEDFEADRRRARFRARFGFSVQIDDSLDVIVQLASGGDNPVSTNQTLGDGFSSKDISLDLAYLDWKINDNLHLNVGKIRNPQFRAGGAPLIWDSDLNPEGLALKFDYGHVFATVAAYSVEERNSSDDSHLYTSQVGLKWPLAKSVTLTAGGGYFGYTNTRGNAAFFNGKAQGNTVDGSGNYLHDFENVELFVELATKVGGWPLTLFVQSVQNTAVSEQDTATAFGAKIGSAKRVGGMEYSWTYQDIEADAVVGTFNDSDFGGGGSDANGHLIKAKYAFRSKVFFGCTLYVTDVDQSQGSRHDYDRIQIDLEFKFN